MNNTQSNQNSDKKLYRIILFAIIGLAAFSSAVKELRQAHAFITEVAQTFSSWSDVMVPTASARTPVKVVAVKTHVDNVFIPQNTSGDFRWNGPVAQGQSIEIKGINGDIRATAAADNEVHVVATKTSRRSDVDSVQIKVVPHAGGVTICALYPDESGNFGDCVSGSGGSKNNTKGQKNNDVRVDFTVQVPARVGFIGKTINGDVAATGLSGNVVTKTINGSIKISTTGYAEAATINGEISARIGDGNWPASLEFQTLNGEINLDLPANLSADIDAETLNGSINSDFPINLTTFKERKRVQGRIGVGGRELRLKTLNGSINLRIAS